MIHLRPGTPADLPAIEHLLQLTPEAAQWLPTHFHVAEINHTLTAFIATRTLLDVGGEHEHEILNLAVHPAHRRQGLAQALIRAVLRKGSWYLEVRESNIAARNLYQLLGFEEISRRPGYYPATPQNPSETGIVFLLRT